MAPTNLLISLVFLLALFTQGGFAAERQLRWKRGTQVEAVAKRRELMMRRLGSQNELADSEEYYDPHSFDVGALQFSQDSPDFSSASGSGSLFHSCGKGGKGGKGGSGSLSGSASGKGKGGSGSASGSASGSGGKGSGSGSGSAGKGGKGKGGSASGSGRRRDLGSGSGSGKGGGSSSCEDEGLPDAPEVESPQPAEPPLVVSPITIVEEQEHLIEEQQDFINSIIAQRRNFSPSNDDPQSNDADSADDRKK